MWQGRLRKVKIKDQVTRIKKLYMYIVVALTLLVAACSSPIKLQEIEYDIDINCIEHAMRYEDTTYFVTRKNNSIDFIKFEDDKFSEVFSYKPPKGYKASIRVTLSMEEPIYLLTIWKKSEYYDVLVSVLEKKVEKRKYIKRGYGTSLLFLKNSYFKVDEGVLSRYDYFGKNIMTYELPTEYENPSLFCYYEKLNLIVMSGGYFFDLTESRLYHRDVKWHHRERKQMVLYYFQGDELVVEEYKNDINNPKIKEIPKNNYYIRQGLFLSNLVFYLDDEYSLTNEGYAKLSNVLDKHALEIDCSLIDSRYMVISVWPLAYFSIFDLKTERILHRIRRKTGGVHVLNNSLIVMYEYPKHKTYSPNPSNHRFYKIISEE